MKHQKKIDLTLSLVLESVEDCLVESGDGQVDGVAVVYHLEGCKGPLVGLEEPIRAEIRYSAAFLEEAKDSDLRRVVREAFERDLAHYLNLGRAEQRKRTP